MVWVPQTYCAERASSVKEVVVRCKKGIRPEACAESFYVDVVPVFGDCAWNGEEKRGCVSRHNFARKS